MKHILFIFSLFCCSTAFAQTDTSKATHIEHRFMTMKGSDLNKMFHVTDRNIYNREGDIIDSVTTIKMVKTLEYQTGYGNVKGQEGLKRVITKIDPARQEQIYQIIKTQSVMRPRSPKTQEGVVLDLKPVANRLDTSKLKSKALLLIFWCEGCYSGSTPDQYQEINDITSAYADPSQLEIMAITHHPFDVGAMALKKSPILNAHHIFDGSDVNSKYDTGDRPLIILTNKEHRIIYAMAQHAAITPWMLNKLLKGTLQ